MRALHVRASVCVDCCGPSYHPPLGNMAAIAAAAFLLLSAGGVAESPRRWWLEFLEGPRFESSRQNMPEMTTFLKRYFSDTANALAPVIR